MKKIILTLCLFIAFGFSVYAQSVPQGMKYQAVARDASGQVIANQVIKLSITLYSEADKSVKYNETHVDTTNQLGLFSLTIGKGEVQKGSFTEVPWSTDNIWMSIAIDETGGDDFIKISDSELLAVPYAFHAVTADELTGDDHDHGDHDGHTHGNKNLSEDGKYWLVGGNDFLPLHETDLDPDPHTLGTTTQHDLILVTNNVPAVFIDGTDQLVEVLGNLEVVNNQKVGIDLTVDNNLYVGNKLVVNEIEVEKDANLNTSGGSTNINGPTTIRNTLDVDASTHLNREGGTTLIDGATTIRNTLDVDESTHLNREGGSTLVDGPTTIRNTLDVDESTHLNREGGSTLVDGPTTIRNTLDVDESTHLNREGGSTLVDGPTTIRNTLDVDESTHLNREGGSTLVDGPTTIRNTLDVDESTHLNREGGSTLVDGPTTIRNTLDVDESTHLNREGGSTTIDGITTITNITQSTAPTNGALNVDGGVGIEKNLNVAENTKMDGTLIVSTSGNAGALGGHVAEFENTDDGNGICIKIGSPQPQNPNNFITFKNKAGTTVGRVEGESTPADLANNLEYQDELDFYDLDIEMADREIDMAENSRDAAIADVAITSAELAMATAALGMEVADQVGASNPAIPVPCGFPAPCVTAGPSAGLTAAAVANVAAAGVNLGLAAANEGLAIANLALAEANVGLAETNKAVNEQKKATFINTHQLLIGVTYASGAGDYAEYLPKLNLAEDFQPGDVVGMKNGMISSNTLNADRVMVISFKPAVLGALPEAGTEDNYEKVAFLGQVLTKTIGKVNKGDYILPSGFHNGAAIAKNPAEMLLTDYKKILGVAWSDSEGEGVNYVNVAVGLNANDLSAVIQKQEEELAALKNQISQTNNILADLVPGFREAANMDGDNVIVDNDIVVDAPLTKATTDVVELDAEMLENYKPVRADYENWLKLARQVMMNRGVDVEAHPFWQRLDTDPDYKEEVILGMESKFDAAYEAQKNK